MLFCKAHKSSAGDPHDAPGLKHDRPPAAIEINSRRVPVKYVPLHAGTTALHCDGRYARQQGFADAAAAMCGLDEKIFKMETRAAPGGINGKVQRNLMPALIWAF